MQNDLEQLNEQIHTNMLLNVTLIRLINTIAQQVKCLILPGLLCATSLMYGQTGWGIRVNQNTDLFTITYDERIEEKEEHQVNFGRFSAGLNYTRGKVVHRRRIQRDHDALAQAMVIPPLNAWNVRDFHRVHIGSYEVRKGFTVTGGKNR